MLAEVGERGQSAIARAVARVGGSRSANDVAALYARGAGFSAVEPGAVDVDALAPTDLVRSEAARDVLAGARAALAEIRRALELEGER